MSVHPEPCRIYLSRLSSVGDILPSFCLLHSRALECSTAFSTFGGWERFELASRPLQDFAHPCALLRRSAAPFCHHDVKAEKTNKSWIRRSKMAAEYII